MRVLLGMLNTNMALGMVGPLAAALALSGCGDWHERVGELQHEMRSIPLDKAETVRVNLRMGVGELTIDGGSAKLMDGEFSYNAPSWQPEVDYRPGVLRGELTISQRSGSKAFPNGENRWNLKLNDTVATSIDARLGVGEARMNLGSMNLRGVEVKMGVGELNLDLRGTPKRSYDVRINGGVGEATIHVPRNVGILATAKGGIGDVNVRGLEKRGSYWLNPGHENDPVVIRVDVHGGVGEITLVAE